MSDDQIILPSRKKEDYNSIKIILDDGTVYTITMEDITKYIDKILDKDFQSLRIIRVNKSASAFITELK